MAQKDEKKIIKDGMRLIRKEDIFHNMTSTTVQQIIEDVQFNFCSNIIRLNGIDYHLVKGKDSPSYHKEGRVDFYTSYTCTERYNSPTQFRGNYIMSAVLQSQFVKKQNTFTYCMTIKFDEPDTNISHKFKYVLGYDICLEV